MGLPAFEFEEELSKKEKVDIESYIKGTHTEEIIIGLCGPIGTDVSFVASRIKNILEKDYGYECHILKLSDFIKEQFDTIDFDNLKNQPYEYLDNLILKGNELRKKYSNSVLAKLAINCITIKREQDKNEDDFKSSRRCYIIDSIKHSEELELFKLIYREIFYFISVFATQENRIKNLTNKRIKTINAHQLIERDYNESTPFGQKVSKIFTEADFFLRLDKSTHSTVDSKVKRYLDLVFSSNIITPTVHESAMYLAAAAAGNSACLSRQVGASITDEIGEIISIGWNDVPKVGGGVYKYETIDPTSKDDFRCMNLEGGVCFNDKEKNNIVKGLVNELIDNSYVDEKNKASVEKIIAESKIGGLIEFSRAIHAEMLAIIIGSQKAGQKMRNGILYCTTYPCHSCARHIVAAGIKEVYYIEPYPKSLATKLHDDAITEDESKEDCVRILIYEGVSPKRYLEFYKMEGDSRKKHGSRTIFSTLEKKPKKTLTLQAIPILEKAVTKDLIDNNLIHKS